MTNPIKDLLHEDNWEFAIELWRSGSPDLLAAMVKHWDGPIDRFTRHLLAFIIDGTLQPRPLGNSAKLTAEQLAILAWHAGQHVRGISRGQDEKLLNRVRRHSIDEITRLSGAKRKTVEGLWQSYVQEVGKQEMPQIHPYRNDPFGRANSGLDGPRNRPFEKTFTAHKVPPDT